MIVFFNDSSEMVKVEEEDEDLKGVKVSGFIGEEVLDGVVGGDGELLKKEKVDEMVKRGFIIE